MTPVEEVCSWESNENVPVSVYWFLGTDLTDHDDVKRERDVAIFQSKIFGITLNADSVSHAASFRYTMADGTTTGTLPSSMQQQKKQNVLHF